MKNFEKFLNACSEDQLVTVEMCIDGMLPDCDDPPCNLERDNEFEEFMEEEHSKKSLQKIS